VDGFIIGPMSLLHEASSCREMTRDLRFVVKETCDGLCNDVFEEFAVFVLLFVNRFSDFRKTIIHRIRLYVLWVFRLSSKLPTGSARIFPGIMWGNGRIGAVGLQNHAIEGWTDDAVGGAARRLAGSR
jgi:hypothetical protein